MHLKTYYTLVNYKKTIFYIPKNNRQLIYLKILNTNRRLPYSLLDIQPTHYDSSYQINYMTNENVNEKIYKYIHTHILNSCQPQVLDRTSIIVAYFHTGTHPIRHKISNTRNKKIQRPKTPGKTYTLTTTKIIIIIITTLQTYLSTSKLEVFLSLFCK